MIEESIGKEIEQVQNVYNIVTEFLVTYSFQLVGAVVIFILGLYVAKKVASFTLRLCEKHNIDITLSTFIANLLKILIIIMMAIIALGKVGISVTPFVAAIGALSLGAGLALQGLLSNYGAGMTIIMTRPFVVGNTITVQNVTGVVKEITLATTLLTNEDNQEITIPNRHIIGEILHNSFANTLVEGSIGISYGSQPDKAIALIEKILAETTAVPGEPAPLVGIDNFADSAIEIGFRYWVPTTNFFHLKYQINLEIFKALQDAGITIPFPQREVRMLGE
jgi:small conductance mechanosensitive channel